MGWDGRALTLVDGRYAGPSQLPRDLQLDFGSIGCADGTLGWSDHREMVERATGRRWGHEEVISWRRVRRWAREADWDFIDTLDEHLRGAAITARAFLNLCADNHLGLYGSI